MCFSKSSSLSAPLAELLLGVSSSAVAEIIKLLLPAQNSVLAPVAVQGLWREDTANPKPENLCETRKQGAVVTGQDRAGGARVSSSKQ